MQFLVSESFLADAIKMSRIVLITPSHPTNSIRMVKEADALSDEGHDVLVFACQFLVPASAQDEVILRSAGWRAAFVNYARTTNWKLFWYSRIRQKFSQLLWRLFNKVGIRPSLGVTLRAFDRVLPELRSLVLRQNADLYIAHGLQALPIAVAAARRHRSRAGFDAEDLYTGMGTDHEKNSWSQLMALSLEREYIVDLDYLTAASPGVAEGMRRIYPDLDPVTIMNVFPLSHRPVARPPTNFDRPLRLYWFSQTIGRCRGLEDAVKALTELPPGQVELHLQGVWQPGFQRYLLELFSEMGVDPAVLTYHRPLPATELVRFASQFDVGLALEVPVSENRRICMRDLCTNKVFTYLLAGLALVASSLDGSADVYGGAGRTYRSGDFKALACLIRCWLDNRDALARARQTAWEISETRYNWDVEKERFLAFVDQRAR